MKPLKNRNEFLCGKTSAGFCNEKNKKKNLQKAESQSQRNTQQSFMLLSFAFASITKDNKQCVRHSCIIELKVNQNY